MKKNKSLIFTILLSILVVILAGCGESDSNGETSADTEENVKLRIAHDSSTNHPSHTALLDFKENVEEKSDGQIEVELYPSAQLGDATEVMEQVRRGDLEMGLGASTHFTNLISELAIWESFYLFDDSEHAHRILDGEAGQMTLDALEEYDITGLGYMEIGFRNFSNSVQPLEEVGDFSGLRIRGYNPLQIKAWEALGVSLTNLSWDELFTSLQQNLIDGQESATTSFYDENFYEAQDFWSLTMHVYTNYLWYANTNFMEGLSEENSNLIMEEVENAIAHERELMAELEEETLELLPSEGVEVNEVDLEVRREMGEIMNDAISEDIIQDTGEEFYEEIMNEIENQRSE